MPNGRKAALEKVNGDVLTEWGLKVGLLTSYREEIGYSEDL
jgi:hypothetical protein